MTTKPAKLVVLPSECSILHLKQPIELYVNDVPGNVYVLWSTLEEYGAGIDLPSALEDLFISVKAFYAFLVKSHAKLSPELQETRLKCEELFD